MGGEAYGGKELRRADGCVSGAGVGGGIGALEAGGVLLAGAAAALELGELVEAHRLLGGRGVAVIQHRVCRLQFILRLEPHLEERLIIHLHPPHRSSGDDDQTHKTRSPHRRKDPIPLSLPVSPLLPLEEGPSDHGNHRNPDTDDWVGHGAQEFFSSSVHSHTARTASCEGSHESRITESLHMVVPKVCVRISGRWLHSTQPAAP